jgi:DNA-directed RNA polymerase subunit RPC12/RpoP
MSGYNLPDGISERDLPGYNDIEMELSVKCGDCGYEEKIWETVDGNTGEYEYVCSNCGETNVGEISGMYDDVYDGDDYGPSSTDYDHDPSYDRMWEP